ncbi:MAG: flagellar hook-length control protein FliK [Planctomycetes bacterium]|nr:flagellar hook-length control protein FliK [Planctomycetota bacterium]
MRLQARPGVRELLIRLEPPELGALRLRFQLRGESVRVSVLATRQDVVSALRSDLSSFAETLRDAGIDLDALDIDLDTGADARQADPRSSEEQLEETARAERRAAEQEQGSDPAAALGRHEGLIDVTV